MGGPAPYCESAGVYCAGALPSVNRVWGVLSRVGVCQAEGYNKGLLCFPTGSFKALSHSHKDFQGAHGNEIGTPHGLTNPQREDPEHNTEKVYRENFHTEAS